MKKGFMKDSAWGISPLGGNSIEGTTHSSAPVRQPNVQEVPLVYDARVGNFISEQGVDDLDDKDVTLARARRFEKDKAWRAKAGIIQK